MIKVMRNYRYICWHMDAPKQLYYCFSNTDVRVQTGINRTALFKILNNETAANFSKWVVIRTNLPVNSPFVANRVNPENNIPIQA